MNAKSLKCGVLIVICAGCGGWLGFGQTARVDAGEPAAIQATPASVDAKRKREYRRFALRQEGDPQRGKDFFSKKQGTACSQCHSVDGTGGRAGPDLFAVGDKFGRRELIEAVLSPSATIADGYGTTVIETKAGLVYQGVIKQVTDSAIELIGSDAEPIRIPTVDIQSRFPSEVSLMPEGVESGLTLQAFTDLIEYLVSCKQPQNAAMITDGMPRVIPPLARPVSLRPFFEEDSTFTNPVWFGSVPREANVFLVAEHETGKVWRLEKGREGDTKTLFADLRPYQKGTRGLLGLTFHPNFRENFKYYYAKQVMENGKFATLVFERKAARDLRRDSGDASRLLLRFDMVASPHYGGSLAFGPDGYFYVGMGDSGPQEDPRGNGQNVELLLGKIVRIDVDHRSESLPYVIPPDNPFLGHPQVRPEIWAYGFREPWRFSFDPVTGDFWVGDVGQDRYEEVGIVRRGENHGWNVYEGFQRFSNQYRREGERHVPPVFAYGRKYGPSVTGGYVYRGDPKSSFYGVYIFGDYESKRIWGLTQENRALKKIRQIGTAPQRVVSFGRDERGELYVVGYEGTIYRIHFTEAVFE